MARVRVQTPSSALRRKNVSTEFDDSPSRQLMRDLERALSQAQIHESELRKVHVYDRRVFQENLDRVETRKAQEDAAALDAATSRHETVRQEAEAELQRYYREVEEQERLRKQEEQRRAQEEQRRVQEEQRRAQEQQAQAKAESERKAKEEAERKAKIEREQAAAKKVADEKAQAEEAKRRNREEAIARQQAEQQRNQKEDQEAKKAAQQASEHSAAREISARETAAETSAIAKPTVQPSGQSSAEVSAGGDAQHQRFLQIHQNLKTFRKEFWSQCKKDANLKSKVGDMRRAIKTSVGQLTEAKGANKQPTERVKSTLRDALNIPSPPIDIRDYLANPPPEVQTPEQSHYPSLLLYVLNIFSKAIMSQFGGESGISIKAAEPAGVLVAQMFSATEYQFQGHSLIDILLAKLHFTCPVLWGVYADEKTAQGRLRLGWRREGGVFVSESRHHERVSGLGAGFASIALRNFTKSRLKNPFPPTNFWECLANILNVPAGAVQPTHLFVLKAMLENSAERFIQFYGSAAVAALRQALVSFPASLHPKMQDTAACKAIMLLVDMLVREKKLMIG